MNQSENINELVSSLAKAQGEMKPAIFNQSQSHFKRKYADFNAVMEACRDPLSKNGLAIMQYAEGDSSSMKLVTMLAHSSGQWIKSYLPILMKQHDCQSLGSAMTYMKRYGVSALLGITCYEDKDDDGETAMGRSKPKEVELMSVEQITDITLLLGEDTEKLQRILSFYKVQSLDNIPSSEYEMIMKRLNGGTK